MSLNSNALSRLINDKQVQNSSSTVKMGIVVAVEEGIKILFYGESEPSQKSYKRLSSYTPAINDVVVLLAVNNSYVIIGKVEE